ncbi:unnamed protein product [Clavelina lepadiformis]|uniref:C2H2-type domain-containing protein n=1 Tax=Clavelina lepadiformis TaxID=159417 RepID=A0ABP0GEU3_CLALP
MENSLEDATSDSIKNEKNTTAGKENINVVIVPESILQAFKNSSSLNLDTDDVANNNSGNLLNIGTTETGECVNNIDLSNGNIWLSLHSNPYYTSNDDITSSNNPASETSPKVTANVGPSIQNGCVQISNSQDKVDAAINNCEVQLPLLDNCVLIPSLRADDTSIAHPYINGTSFGPTNPNQPAANSYISMRIQSVESDGDKSIYTLAPAFNLDANVNFLTDQVTADKFQADVDNVTTSLELQIPVSINNDTTTTENPQKTITVSRADSSVPTVILRETSAKTKVATADKATYADGSKSLHRCMKDGCNEVFKSALQYRKHVSTVHELGKMYKCKHPNCKWSFQTPYKLKRHLQSHYKGKPYVCPYPGCNVGFSIDYNLKAHLKMHNTVMPERVCKVCDLLLSSKQELHTHMRKVHDEKPSFPCNICGKHCHTSAALVMHKRAHDAKKYKYDCPVCDKKFARRSELKMHLYTHTGERPFQCPHCEWGFVSLSRLNRHMMTHESSGRFKCSQANCDSSFHRLHHLVAHMRQVHKIQEFNDDRILQEYITEAKGGKEFQYFNCDACGCGFLSAHGLGRHQLKCLEFMALSERPPVTVSVDVNGTDEPLDDAMVVHVEDYAALKVISTSSNASDKSVSEVNKMTKIDSLENFALGQNKNNFKENKSNPTTSQIKQLATAANETLPISTNEDTVVTMNNDWVAALLPDLSQKINCSRYLACHGHDQASHMTLVPFMDDVTVLNDTTTQQFLRLDDAITSCVDSVNVPADCTDHKGTGNADLLQQYVIGAPSLDDIEVSEDLDISGPSYDEQTCSTQATGLFTHNISLASDEEQRNPMTSAHFSGTTINLNDLH